MQNSNKKRRLDFPAETEDDWGDDITAEEFDFCLSQVVIPKPVSAGNPVPLNIIPNTEQIQEEQLALEGEVRMLREALEKKSRELDVERQQREIQVTQRLKEQNKKESDLKLNIDRLESDIKFKQHELANAHNKIKLLELKANQALSTSKLQNSTPAKRQSPVKIPLNVVTRHFANTPVVKNMFVQTETTNAVIVPKRNCVLSSKIAYNFGCKFLVSTTNKNSLSPCNAGGCLDRPSMVPFVSGNSYTFSEFDLSVPNQLSKKLHPVECCCKSPQIRSFPNKELELIKVTLGQLKVYVQHLSDHKKHSESDRSKLDLSCNDTASLTSQFTANSTQRIKRAEWNSLTTKTAICLSELSKLLSSSLTACVLLVKPFHSSFYKNATDVPNNELLQMIWACTKPIFVDTEVVNGSVIVSALTVLNIISNNCGQCCINVLSTGLLGFSATKLLNNSCGLQSAYLSTKLLASCAAIKNFQVHRDALCLFKSIEELLRTLSIKSSVQNVQFFLCLLNWVSVLIIHNGADSVFNERCICLGKVLRRVCACLLDSQYLDSELVLKMLQLLQMLAKRLSSSKWTVLQMHMDKCLLLMLNKLRHNKLFSNPAHRLLIMELCDYAKISYNESECVPMEC